ncbi:hypothetical protein BWQ96_07192 [Gracilariopsis chorda]|uniref:Uncharacterized protein n=1 Tax=Gracilariopsis chorda TaxID=448386 RepID=A0A2V3ILT4_9FLOR|nr:hypothetical protein BWQ96_07192 [Gracilariopsis chorda]|eukprot:PXF43045.1 hypothetical protein BWQ96_07192 [Gracilariopsis chorda]
MTASILNDEAPDDMISRSQAERRPRRGLLRNGRRGATKAMGAGPDRIGNEGSESQKTNTLATEASAVAKRRGGRDARQSGAQGHGRSGVIVSGWGRGRGRGTGRGRGAAEAPKPGNSGVPNGIRGRGASQGQSGAAGSAGVAPNRRRAHRIAPGRGRVEAATGGAGAPSDAGRGRGGGRGDRAVRGLRYGRGRA